MKIAYQYRGVIYLVLLLLAMPWFAVRYALNDTIAAWIDCRRLRIELDRTKVVEPSTAASTVLAGDVLLNGELLSSLQSTAAGRRVAISDYRPLVTMQGSEIRIHTAALVSEGAYGDILQVIRHIEREIAPCRISSLRFASVTPPEREARRLEATVYVEQVVEIQ